MVYDDLMQRQQQRFLSTVLEISEKGAVLGGGGPVRGVNVMSGFLVVRLREVRASEGCWCEGGAVLEDTCPAECDTFSFWPLGTCRCTKAAGEEDRQTDRHAHGAQELLSNAESFPSQSEQCGGR